VSRPIGRRRFLAGTAGLAVVGAACSGDDDDGGGGTGDLEVAATAAGLERLAVETYTTLTRLAVDGRLGAVVPPAVTGFTSAATGHHQEHLDTWNRLLTAGRRPAVDAADARLKPQVEGAVTRLVDIPGLVTLALRLEDYAAQTYLRAIPTLTSPDSIRTAAQIAVVDEQHQVILRYLLGLYPVGSGLSRDTIEVAPASPSW
jgi:hypothetical protein